MEYVDKESIRNIMIKQGLDVSTMKNIRQALEKQNNLEKDELKPMKEDIKKLVNDIMEEYTVEKNSEKLFTCKTKSGAECPKNIKNIQSKNGDISKSDFLNSRKDIKIDIDGNILSGMPREFSSGNLGWYLTGKIELNVNDKTIWSQVGLNITIPGSQNWK